MKLLKFQNFNELKIIYVHKALSKAQFSYNFMGVERIDTDQKRMFIEEQGRFLLNSPCLVNCEIRSGLAKCSRSLLMHTSTRQKQLNVDIC